MVVLLARVPALRLVRTPRAWLPIAAWVAVALVAAIAARSHGASSGASQVLRGTFAGLALPLLAYAIVGASLGNTGIRKGIRGVVALGATPRDAALASIAVAVLVSTALSGALGALSCVVAHGSHDPPLALDLFASLWVSALGGAAYAAYFSVGSAIAKGTMRGVFLALDWIVGGGASVGALLTPRGHVVSLLGGSLCAGLPARASCVVLVVMVAVFGALALRLARRR